MHILFLTDNFPPEVNAPATRTYEHCREWVKAGHRVTVITCAPNFPKGKVFVGYRNQLWQTEEMSGIRVIRVWTYITANEGFAKRILDYVSFMVTGSLAALFVRQVDVIVGTSPQFFTVCASYFVGAIKRRPWIFELRDLWPESITALGMIDRKRTLHILEALELFLYRKAAAIVSVTHAFKRRLAGRGIDPQKITVVTNGVDVSRFRPVAKDRTLVKCHGLGGMFVAGYIGTHGLSHGLDTLVDAAKLLRGIKTGANVRFLLLGDGAQRAGLKARAEAEGLDNILFLESVGKEDVVRYWSVLDAAIIHLKRSDLFTTVIPSKLFESMAMGIPVLHGVEGESAQIVLRHDVGLTFEAENASNLVETLLRLRDDDLLRARLSANGPVAVIQYDRAILARELLDVVERCASGRHRHL
jgi:hypothetical protein